MNATTLRALPNASNEPELQRLPGRRRMNPTNPKERDDLRPNEPKEHEGATRMNPTTHRARPNEPNEPTRPPGRTRMNPTNTNELDNPKVAPE